VGDVIAQGWMTGVKIPAEAESLLFTTTSTMALGPKQPPIQQTPMVLSQG